MRTVGTLNAPPKSPNVFPTNAPSLSLSISLIVALSSPAATQPIYPELYLAFSDKNYYYQRHVRRSSECFSKFRSQSRPRPNGCRHSGLVAEQCSALGQRDRGGGCPRTILDARADQANAGFRGAARNACRGRSEGARRGARGAVHDRIVQAPARHGRSVHG